ncbi:hypothetical protein [Clostridium perfringens]|uniref:Uncharacterized protein n=1 Tax=Clostridium perfringens TaxID=1502 RepID=A0AAW4IY32_CLOPF|nr:hypothetical protein [Clostridium perfringens]MBO3356152.1 hypothetical protein [Clostridium perfringens]MBO3359507.1 hypothetical protein [Clostridium perfringens]
MVRIINNEIKELRGLFPHELNKNKLKNYLYLHSDDIKEGFINETLVWYKNNTYNREIFQEDKYEREDIITKVKLKGREFEKEIIHKIETGIIKDWYQLALVL